MSEVLKLVSVCKSYSSPAGGRINILSDVSLSIAKGEVVAIVGRSGSGKSTLLFIAALLSTPDSGRIFYDGRDSSTFRENEIAALRSKGMGFVFQNAELLADFSALENVAMPMLIQGMKKREAMDVALDSLKMIGLEERKNHRPRELSGGERQRVAIARALAGNPLIVFADEPTGSLDEKSADDVEALLFEAVKGTGHSMLLVTHNSAFASKADRVLELREGALHDIGC